MGLRSCHVMSSSYHPQSNGRTENAVKTCKSLLIKARADKHDMGLLEWRNTPSKGLNESPVQLLYSRQTHTHLPFTKSLLVPQVISDVPEKIMSRKQKQKFCDIVTGTPINCLHCMTAMQ